jgi:hypothetical protein
VHTLRCLFLVCLSLSISATAAAVPISFTGTVSDGTWNDVTDRGTNATLGAGVPGAIWELSFDLGVGVSDLGVSFTGTPAAGSPALVPVSYAQATGVPVFQDGINTLRFTILNDAGPDASDWGISGSTLLLAPEPSTGLLVAFGFLLLARRRARS